MLQTPPTRRQAALHLNAPIPFHNLYRHGFARVAVAVPRCRVADPAFNAARDDRAAARGRGRAARCWSPSPSWACRPTPATTCSTSARCSTPARRRSRAVAAASARCRRRRRRRPAAARRPPALQLRRGRRARPRARRRAEDLPAELRRVLRGAPVQRRPTPRCATEVELLGGRRAVRRRPAVRGRRPAAAEVPRRDLRGRLGADPAVELRGAGRRDGAGQPVGLEHHDRQVRLPAPAGQPAVGALPRGLPVLVGRPRRVDHRPGLGRPGADLRERRRCWPSRERFANGSHFITRRRRPRARCRASACGRTRFGALGRSSTRARCARSARVALRAARCRAATPLPLRARVERFPYVPADPAHARRALQRGLQHPGPGAGAAARGDRHRASW